MTRTSTWNWSALLGPPVAFGAVVSYLTWIHRWPALSDVPWLNFAVLALAVCLSAQGLAWAWRRGRVRRALAALGLGLSASIAGLFVWWAVIGSSELPSGGLALGDPLPKLSLTDPDGQPVQLASLQQPLVIVFYRGHW
jgi:hypothetical protein